MTVWMFLMIQTHCIVDIADRLENEAAELRKFARNSPSSHVIRASPFIVLSTQRFVPLKSRYVHGR